MILFSVMAGTSPGMTNLILYFIGRSLSQTLRSNNDVFARMASASIGLRVTAFPTG